MLKDALFQGADVYSATLGMCPPPIGETSVEFKQHALKGDIVYLAWYVLHGAYEAASAQGDAPPIKRELPPEQDENLSLWEFLKIFPKACHLALGVNRAAAVLLFLRYCRSKYIPELLYEHFTDILQLAYPDQWEAWSMTAESGDYKRRWKH